MSKVFVTTYEIIGARHLAQAHYAAIDAARDAHWSFVSEVGGVGYRPGHNGGLSSVFFESLSEGWRKVGFHDGKVEARPLKNTKIGKALARKINDLRRAPQAPSLAGSYGYNPRHFPIDGGSIYFPSEIQVKFPDERIFLRIPRFADDGFEPDETNLRAVPESELMAAIEAHNAWANRLREGGVA